MTTQPAKFNLLVINYHQITRNANNSDLYTLPVEILRQHFTILKEELGSVFDLRQTALGPTSGGLQVSICFDDGYKPDYDIVLPLLKENGFTASFFPVTNYVGKPNRCNWQQLKELSDLGHEIGSHSVSHEVFSRLSVEQQQHEMKVSKHVIDQMLGLSTEAFAFPYGNSSQQAVEEALRLGYKRCYTTGMRQNTISTQDYFFYRWNNSNKTGIAQFKNVITSGGEITPASELHCRLQKIGLVNSNTGKG